MSNVNDLKILELKSKISKKKEDMSNMQQRFSPITSCILELDGCKYNLNIMKEDELKLLHVKINSLYKSAIDLKIPICDIKISGFDLDQWMGDIYNKIGSIKYKEDKKNLDIMESKLNKLLSEEKKVELEIDAISSMLNI